ncbi:MULTISPECIES: helix-turn-helix domain-containing protein [unclassified Clostridium]|uniref:helix-turn-helix domain-containing protein n=1 Tax=unclassified Clostridium TaxID=2614128 RepID=UPI001E174938|nr:MULTISPECIES: helix-turn-helix domain-containing protein [unclassified Clostridium]MBN1045516.1 helix-turn-helix domain-containing protein [Clostridium botulinum]MBN1052236.1 helix-turn-helix domain-containing protein [Clostridium botulinum]
MPTFGERFKQLRIEKNLKQEELINDFNKKFHFSFTKSAVSQYENDKRIPEIQALNAFADYFHVPVDYLLGRTDEKCLIIDEPELSLHEQYANKIAKILQSEGLEYTEDTITEIIDYSKYILSKKKKQD